MIQNSSSKNYHRIIHKIAIYKCLKIEKRGHALSFDKEVLLQNKIIEVLKEKRETTYDLNLLVSK